MSHPRSTPLAVAGLLVACATFGGVAMSDGVARAEPIERVIAVVNDQAVLLSDLRRRATPYLEHALRGSASEGERKARIKSLYDQLAQQLIDEELIEQSARKMMITVSSLEVEQAIDNVRRQSGLEEARFWEAVREQGFTERQYREDVRKQLLRLKVINQRVRSRVNISDEMVRESYDDRMRQARRNQRFRAAHIFFPLPETAAATEVAEVSRQVEALRATLTTVESFDEAIQARGGGGELGWLDQGDLPNVLEDVLLGLNVGDISQPVRGPSGIHLFVVRERQAGHDTLPPFEELRSDIQRELLDRAMQRQEELFIRGLRRDAVITVRL